MKTKIVALKKARLEYGRSNFRQLMYLLINVLIEIFEKLFSCKQINF